MAQMEELEKRMAQLRVQFREPLEVKGVGK